MHDFDMAVSIRYNATDTRSSSLEVVFPISPLARESLQPSWKRPVAERIGTAYGEAWRLFMETIETTYGNRGPFLITVEPNP